MNNISMMEQLIERGQLVSRVHVVVLGCLLVADSTVSPSQFDCLWFLSRFSDMIPAQRQLNWEPKPDSLLLNIALGFAPPSETELKGSTRIKLVVSAIYLKVIGAVT